MADLNYGEIYWGPFAHNGSKHMALLAYYTDTHVFLFPISSQQSTQDYWYRIDSRAVVELEETEANAIFGSGAKQSFIYCGDQNCMAYTRRDFSNMLSRNHAIKRRLATRDLLLRVQTGILESVTYDDEFKEGIARIM